MKAALIIFFMITNIVRAQFIQNDKLLLMGGSYVISSSVTAITYDRTSDKRKSIIYGMATAMTIGLAKEMYDRKHGNPDVKDMLANFVGASLGVITIRIAI